jgi:hypothetical protein
MWKITKDNKVFFLKNNKVLLFKSKFYTLNYEIDSKIFKFNYHCHLNYKEMNLFCLKGGSKLVYIIKIFIYVKIN